MLPPLPLRYVLSYDILVTAGSPLQNSFQFLINNKILESGFSPPKDLFPHLQRLRNRLLRKLYRLRIVILKKKNIILKYNQPTVNMTIPTWSFYQ